MNAAARELDIPTCSYDEWMEKLEERASDMVEMEEAQLFPALKAMDFFRGLKDSVKYKVSAPPFVEGKATMGVRKVARGDKYH